MDLSFQNFNLEEINQKGKTKAFITEKILSFGVYIHVIISFVYNAIFIFFINNNLNLIALNEQVEQECEILVSWAQTILVWTTICIIKTFLFICCLRCNDTESDSNDCSIICLFIKSITSYIPAIIFNYKLGSLVDKVYNNEYCVSIDYLIKMFKSFEYYYVVSFSTFLCGIPSLAILMSLKELWKSRK